MDRDDPSELELSLRALLDPVTDSSEGRLVLLPDSSARAAITCLGSVLLWSSLDCLASLPRSGLRWYEDLLKGLNGSRGPILNKTGTLSSPRPYLPLFLLVNLGSDLLVSEMTGTPSLDLRGELVSGDASFSSLT